VRRVTLLLLLCAVLALPSCVRKGPPAPVFNYGLQTRENLAALVRKETPAPVAPSPPAKRVSERVGAAKALRIQRPASPRPHLNPPPPRTARTGEKRFIWPVHGRVVSGYGAKPGGLYNDGINIAAPRGTAVFSAADGTVAYVGDKLGGYGNLILIRHDGGMMTAYAHLGLVTVRQGAHVKRGSVIGGVGATGGVPSPQLHFEIRKGGDAVDPARYLG
jgi:murein DD-endopeptidase MepM/ murein hydrolase activator NlpD